MSINIKYHSPFSGELVHFHSFKRGVNVIGLKNSAVNKEKKSYDSVRTDRGKPQRDFEARK